LTNSAAFSQTGAAARQTASAQSEKPRQLAEVCLEPRGEQPRPHRLRFDGGGGSGIFAEIRMIDAIHVATINGRPLRFFASADAGDPPWVSWPDLMATLGWSFVKRASTTRKLRKKNGDKIIEPVTPQGRTLVVPNWMAGAVIWVETRDKTIDPGVDAQFAAATQSAAQAVAKLNTLAAIPAAGAV
jgi:hypothetical protein